MKLYVQHFYLSALTCATVLRLCQLGMFNAVGIAFASAIGLHVFYASILWPFLLSPLRDVPTVKGFPLWGQTFTLITQEVAAPLRDWHDELGPIIRFFHPLGSERLSIADDDAIKEILQRDPYNYPKPRRIRQWMAQVLGDSGVLLAEGKEHARQRRVLAPAFSTSAVRELLPVFWEKSLRMVEVLSTNTVCQQGTGSKVEVLELTERMTLDVICSTMGMDINSLEHPEHELRKAYQSVFPFDLVARTMFALLTYSVSLNRLPLKINETIHSAKRTIAAFASKVVNSHQMSTLDGRRRSILSHIKKTQQAVAFNPIDNPLSQATLRDQVMTLIAAGHDTTATGVAWTLDQLAKHPHIQAKLRSEIHKAMPELLDPTLRAQHLDNAKAGRDMEALLGNVDSLPYLDNVCRESLRFIPPIPLTLRRSQRQANLGGYHVPAGTLIFVASNAINRLKSYWGPTANIFDPDRWLTLPPTWRPNAYSTFLAGPRGCIGRRFSEVEMKVALCCLLASFEFETDPDFEDQEQWKMWRLVLHPRDGINLLVKPVEESSQAAT